MRAVKSVLTQIVCCAAMLNIPQSWGALVLGVVQQPDTRAITILFVNGIRNAEFDAAKSSELLIQSLKDPGLSQSTYNFTYFFNPTDGNLGAGDVSEVWVQQGISNDALLSAGSDQGKYFKALGDYYNNTFASRFVLSLSRTNLRVVTVANDLKQRIKDILSKSAGVVIVPHSQGNLYVEAAYAMLVAEGNAGLLSRIQVVGVANAARTTPSNRYFTHTDDKVILAYEVDLAIAHGLSFRPMQGNQTACYKDMFATFCDGHIALLWSAIGDGYAHGFGEIYLNSKLTSEADGRQFPKVTYDLVTESLASLASRSSYTYIPHTFGPDINSNIWNIWAANGSNLWDFRYNYVNGFLHYSFKLHSYSGYYCSASCRLHVIWNKNPSTGFDANNVLTIRGAEFPESIQDDHVYTVDFQWKTGGYRVSVYDQTAAQQYSVTDYAVATPLSQVYDAFGDYYQWSVNGFPPGQPLYTSVDAATFASGFNAHVHGADVTGTDGGGFRIGTPALPVVRATGGEF